MSWLGLAWLLLYITFLHFRHSADARRPEGVERSGRFVGSV